MLLSHLLISLNTFTANFSYQINLLNIIKTSKICAWNWPQLLIRKQQKNMVNSTTKKMKTKNFETNALKFNWPFWYVKFFFTPIHNIVNLIPPWFFNHHQKQTIVVLFVLFALFLNNFWKSSQHKNRLNGCGTWKKSLVGRCCVIKMESEKWFLLC